MSAAVLVSPGVGHRAPDNLAARPKNAGDPSGFGDILAALPQRATPNVVGASRGADLGATAIGAGTPSSVASADVGRQDEAALSHPHFAASTWSPADALDWPLTPAPRQIAGPTSPPSAPLASRGAHMADPNATVARERFIASATSRPQATIAESSTSSRGSASAASVQESALGASNRKAAVVHAPSQPVHASATIVAAQVIDPGAAMLSAQSALAASAAASAQAPMPAARSASLQTGSVALGAGEAMGGDNRPVNRSAVTDADLIGLTEVAVGARSVATKSFHAPTRPAAIGAAQRSPSLPSPGKAPTSTIPDGDTTGAQKHSPSPDAASQAQDGKSPPNDSGGGAELSAQNGVAAIDVAVTDAPPATYSAGEVLGLLASAATDLGAQAAAKVANAPQAATSATTKQLEITMDPEGLGTLTATLTLSAGAISIVLEATTAEGEAAMNAQLGALTSRLSAGAQPIVSIKIIRTNPDSQQTETSDATDFESSPSSGARTAATARQFPSGRGVGGDMVV